MWLITLTGTKPPGTVSYLSPKVEDHREVSAIIVIKTTAGTRPKFLIPALDLLLQVGAPLQGTHVVQVGGQADH